MTTLQISAGWIVTDQSECHGGVHSRTRETAHERDGERIETTRVTDRTIDNVTVVKRADRIKARVDEALREQCSRMGRAWFVDADRRPALDARIDEIRAEADEANAMARDLGAARRVYVDVLYSRVEVDEESTARSITRQIVGALTEAYELIKTGNVAGSTLDNLIRFRLERLDRLSSGVMADAIKFAVDEIKASRKQIKARIKSGMTPESAGRQEPLGYTETAIDLFGGTVPTLTDDASAPVAVPAPAPVVVPAPAPVVVAVPAPAPVVVAAPAPAPTNGHTVEIPFAAPQIDAHGWHCFCPECARRIDLADEDLDAETPAPLAEHYRAAH